MSQTPRASRRARVGGRLALYGGLALGVVLVLGALRPSARRDLGGLVASLGPATGHELSHREGLCTVNFFPGRGYALSMFVADDAAFAPARVLVVVRLDGQVHAELLVGNLRTEVLGAQESREYLTRSGLDLTGLDAAYDALYRHPRGGRALAAGAGNAALLPVGK